MPSILPQTETRISTRAYQSVQNTLLKCFSCYVLGFDVFIKCHTFYYYLQAELQGYRIGWKRIGTGAAQVGGDFQHLRGPGEAEGYKGVLDKCSARGWREPPYPATNSRCMKTEENGGKHPLPVVDRGLFCALQAQEFFEEKALLFTQQFVSCQQPLT